MKRLVCVLSICLMGGVFMGAAVAETELSITSSSQEITLACDLEVFASVEWDQVGPLTDVYLAVMDDTGAIRFFYPGCACPLASPTPFMGRLFLPEGYVIDDCFLARFSAEMLAFSSVPQTYWMVLALTRRGFLDMVCEPAFAEFRVTRVLPRTWRDSGPNYVTFDYIDHRWYLTEVNLEVNHAWSTYLNAQTSSGSDINYFVRRGRWELDDIRCNEFTWRDGGSSLGLWVNLSGYDNYASVSAYGYDRQTLPGGGRAESWSLSTTLRP